MSTCCMHTCLCSAPLGAPVHSSWGLRGRLGDSLGERVSCGGNWPSQRDRRLSLPGHEPHSRTGHVAEKLGQDGRQLQVRLDLSLPCQP